MSKSKYPLIENLGLKVHDNGIYQYININDLERVLEKAPVVYGIGTKECGSVIYGDSVSPNAKWEITARLLCIQPIAKPDTAESLLREIFDNCDGENALLNHNLYERAKRLLEEK